MNRNGYREEKSWCYFHPKQVVVGVCPLCLNERLLLLLASKQHNNRSSACKSSSSSSTSSHKLQSSTNHRKQPSTSSSSIHKIFAFGSLFTRLDSRGHFKSHHNHNHFDVSPGPEEESFISIKFEENGIASWEKNTVVSKEKNCNNESNTNTNTNTKSVIEHGKSRETFRWRKRIGHMFQLIRWKKSTTGKVDVGVKKVRNNNINNNNSKSKSNWMLRSSLTTKRNKSMSKTTTATTTME